MTDRAEKNGLLVALELALAASRHRSIWSWIKARLARVIVFPTT